MRTNQIFLLLPCLNIFQSVLKCHTAMSHKIKTKNSKSHKFPKENNEKMLSLKQSRKFYCSQLTKVIKKSIKLTLFGLMCTN